MKNAMRIICIARFFCLVYIGCNWCIAKLKCYQCQQISNQTASQEESKERIRERILKIAEVWKGNQIRPQGTLVQLLENNCKTHQATSKCFNTITHWTRTTPSIPTLFQASWNTSLPDLRWRARNGNTLSDVLQYIRHTEEATATNPRQGPESRTGDSGRRKEAESTSGIHQWLRTL